MRPFRPWLVCVALLAPPAGPAEDALAATPAAPEPFAGMDPAAQQQWLRDILTRLDRANRVVLGPDEVARQRARSVGLLRQINRGETISQTQLLSLLRQTDAQEKAAIGRLARQFRVQVYHTFRRRRGVFTRRRAAWNRVLASWEAAGSRFEQQDRLLDWLQAAIQVSLPETLAGLPPDPEFRSETDVSQAIVRSRPAKRIEEPMAPPPALSALGPVSRPPRPAVNPAERSRQVTEPGRPDQPHVEMLHSPRPGAVPSTSSAWRKVADRPPTVGQTAGGRPSPSATRPPAELPSAAPRSDRSAPPVRVNLDELSAQIAGVNLALRALEAELDQQRPWSAAELGPLFDRLSTLVTRSDDLATFRELISRRERALVGRLGSPRSLIPQVAARIFEARTRTSGPDFPGTAAQRQAELQHLDELSRKLAGLASRK